jgi:hypothetical protein
MEHKALGIGTLFVALFCCFITSCGGDDGELPDLNITLEPEEVELEPEVIERSRSAPADHLAIRITRLGHMIEPGSNLSIEHRGEIQVPVGEDGKIHGTGHGEGESINDYSPYSFDVCRYDIDFRVEGKLKLPDCVLELELLEEILGGDCTHQDPNQTLNYPYAAWGEEDALDIYTFPNIHGKDSFEWESNEDVGKIHWIDTLQVWIIKDLPICDFVEDTAAPPPTLEPWYTPTWKPQ